MAADGYVSRWRWKRKAQSTNHHHQAHGLLNGSSPVATAGPGGASDGTPPDHPAPAASANGPKSHRLTNGTALGGDTRPVQGNRGAWRHKRGTRNSGTEAPALVNGDSLAAGEHVGTGSSSTHPAVVQSNTRTAAENGCPSSTHTHRRRRGKKAAVKAMCVTLSYIYTPIIFI